MIRRLWMMTLAVGLGLVSGCLHAQWTDGSGTPSVEPKKQEVVSAHPSPEGPVNQQTGGTETPRDPDVRPAPIERTHAEAVPAEPPFPPSKPPQRLPLLPATAEEPPPPDPPAVAALRLLLKKHSAEACAQLQSYDRARQELLLGLLPLAARVASSDYEHASPQEKAAILEQMMALVQLLRSQAPLVLAHLCFCQEIQGFAAYQPLPPDYEFQPCRNGPLGEHMRVYVEVRNFNSQPCVGGLYQTRLTPTVEILDFHKRVVKRMPLRTRTARTRSPQQDYFINIQFNLPPNMPQGLYTLRVEVRDEARPFNGSPAPRVATGSLDFRVGGNGCRGGPSASLTAPAR